MERYSKSPKNRISLCADSESDIYNNHIELFIAIKKDPLNNKVTQHEMLMISNKTKVWFNFKLKDNENLQKYTRRFKMSTEILDSWIGWPIQSTNMFKNEWSWQNSYKYSTTTHKNCLWRPTNICVSQEFGPG